MDEFVFVENNLYAFTILGEKEANCFEIINKEKLESVFDVDKYYTLEDIKQKENVIILAWEDIPKSVINKLKDFKIVKDCFNNYKFNITNLCYLDGFDKSCFFVNKNEENAEKDINSIDEYMRGDYEMILNNHLPYNFRVDIYNKIPVKQIISIV